MSKPISYKEKLSLIYSIHKFYKKKEGLKIIDGYLKQERCDAIKDVFKEILKLDFHDDKDDNTLGCHLCGFSMSKLKKALKMGEQE